MAESIDRQLAEISAVLVEDRILRRVIKRHRRLPGIGLQVPHADVYALPSAELAKLVERGELAVELSTMSEHVIAFRGSRDALAAASPQAHARAWRAIFHGRVHQHFDALLARDQLTAAAIRERVNRIGQTEFDEIRFALRQAELLLPPDNDTNTYIEFVALYLELKHFAPHAVERTFPTLDDAAHVDATIALDLDPAALLAAARPPGAPEQPIVDTPSAAIRRSPTGAGTVDPSASSAAVIARGRGNHARAAILSARAGDRDAARADLDALAARLGHALDGAAPAGWAAALLAVAEAAAAQPVLRYTAGSRLLHDLQTACVVAEREVKTVDVVGWVTSLGRRPIVRTLPATREVRVAKHLHSAARKLADVELATVDDRERLADALHAMIEHAEGRVRAVLRPELEAALADVQLAPRHLPERVAQKKLVDELLDQAVAVGRLSLGNLRDAISHNDLKMPNLRPMQLVRGDQLLRCDRRLADTLDGVYRRGEIYLRFLQKISSVLFGTALGRLLSLYVMLPVLGAFTAVEGAQHVVGPLTKLATGHEPELATPAAFAGVGGFLFLLIHAPPFRRAVGAGLRGLGLVLRAILIDAPRAVWRLAPVRRFLESRFARLVVRPAIPAVIIWLLVHGRVAWPIAAGAFVMAELVGNSRIGRLAEEIAADWLVRGSRHFARRIVPGMIKYLLELFAELIELLERGIYRVDEALRFKVGQSRATLVGKGVLGTLWFFVSYFLRLYVNLFVEPVVNPIKHFPVVTVAAKLTLPVSPAMIRAIRHPLRKVVGHALAHSAAVITVFVIPGLAGFLVWELKENWKLYDATRPETVRAISIGHHGETMVGFMKPGFHSGTIPKLYAKLRRAAWKGDEHGVAKYREGLHHVEEAIWRFADRALVSMLNEAESFGAVDVAVLGVEIASNRVQIVTACPSVGPEPATIVFEEQSGWLLASIRRPGWIDQLEPKMEGGGLRPTPGADQRAIFETALAGFYKLSGVDLVREQLEAVLGECPYDVSNEGLVAWPGTGYRTEVVYDLASRELAPAVRGAPLADAPASLAGRHALFAREPLRWIDWTAAWQLLAAGAPPTRIAAGPSLLRAR